MPLIDCNALSRSFDDSTAQNSCRIALDDVSFTVERGEFIAVVGASGAGKSTLLNLLGGLDRPSGGALRVDGLDLRAASERDLDAHRRDRVGFIFQSYHLNPRRTAIENVMLPLVFAPRARISAEPRLLAAQRLREVSLEALVDRRVSTLSGGQRQRVAIARALVMSPPLLLADEPVGNLDAATGKEIVDLLVSINRAQQVTILAVSHDEMLLRAATRVLELREGRLTVHAGLDSLRSIAALSENVP